MKHIFGPVPSRRLGISLGVDIVPYKTCTFDCLYCQLGKTTKQTLKRREYVRAQDILKELNQFLKTHNSLPSLREAGQVKLRTPNYITLSGSGEPTLNSRIGEIISGIKKMTSIPIALLTNGSLLYRREVRNSLIKADLVIPSLDAADARTFMRINRPAKSLCVEKIIEGLVNFRKEYRGKIWLEIMFVKGVNDEGDEIEKLGETIARVRPDRVQLNTVTRPPCEKSARSLSNRELERIKDFLGPPAEVIVDFERRTLPKEMKDLERGIMTMLKRRPATIKDLADGLGVHRNEVLKYLVVLAKEKKVKQIRYEGKRYYQTG